MTKLRVHANTVYALQDTVMFPERSYK